jgi:hypothetical protein
MKTESGVRLSHMQEFFLLDNISYSLEEVTSFTREAGQMEQKLEAFLNQRLRGEEADLEEVIAVGMALGEEIPYTHAVAILAHDKGDTLIFSDSAAETERYWPAKPAGQRDKKLF